MTEPTAAPAPRLRGLARDGAPPVAVPGGADDERRRGSAWEQLGLGPGARPPVPDGVPLAESTERFANRELSWLEFANRLLDLAADGRQPLLERVKFLAIFTEGLDEFFQVRVAGLEDQVAAGLRTRSPDGLGPGEQLAAIAARVTTLVARQNRIFADGVEPLLRGAGILIDDWHTLADPDREHLDDVYTRTIFPVLTPLAVDQGHPFPYISNLSLNLVLRVVDPATDEQRIARVKVPPLLPRFVALPDGSRFVPVEQVIAAHLGTLFPAMSIVEHHVFRVTRNADLSVDEDDAQDLLAAVELELHRRRFGQAVRLEVASGISTDLLDMLVSEVDVPEDNVFLSDVPLDLGGLRDLAAVDRPDLAPEPWVPLAPPPLTGERDLFEVLAEGDVLLHHPYESFAASVEAFVERAAADPDVLAIRQTLYRTGTDSPIVAALIRASHSGKEVTAVVELQARFDERANIAWARALEEAGVQVVYGLARLKTHSKMSLVIRREGDVTRRYCHVGSGNYNSVTALTYEDIGLLTADPDIGADVAEVFNLLTGAGSELELRRLIVSPVTTPSRGDRRHRRRGGGRTERSDRAQDERSDRPRGHRRPLPCVGGGVPGRPGGPRSVWHPSRRARAVRAHPRPLDRRPVPRALAAVPLRGRPRPAPADLVRVARHDGAQPRPAGGGRGSGGGPGDPAAPGADPRRRPPRRGQLVDARRRRGLGPHVPGGRCRVGGVQPAGPLSGARPGGAPASPRRGPRGTVRQVGGVTGGTRTDGWDAVGARRPTRAVRGGTGGADADGAGADGWRRRRWWHRLAGRSG